MTLQKENKNVQNIEQKDYKGPTKLAFTNEEPS